ncbi:putative alpha/beta hydrolase family protein DUF2235 [Luteibacter rhizovicinus]|uniref:Putative alpha/beta hydrolase family protein DUF2235 n=1 Tax=Luteibacter rhizovicinus TaxID=242606 RepID=A0A4R3YT70_9GAMM|nr:DUF2235 domain-containing protein [Luteibacter rhizovicinus]TCV96117.1 putative alpha/beta hydrolase family protein DUF2235 [Luteibacter rhizovicinus]
MTEKHERDPNGQLQDSVSTYALTATDMAIFQGVSVGLASLPVPTLYCSSNPHDRLYVASFDGTGNDVDGDPEHATNVALMSKSLKNIERTNPNIRVQYLEGPGTQKNALVRMADGALGYTYDARLEAMYRRFIGQASAWLEEDPQAKIRIIETGFSRGADQAAGFARMVHERGIQDPSGFEQSQHLIGPDEITYSKPALVAPGKVPQAVALFDPVGTGTPQKRDRHLPPSVVSGFQIVARDERRNAFPSSQIIPQGLSADGRFLGVTVPGAHSDIGGSYHVDGLARLNGNLMADYINALSDTPLVQKRELPDDPERYVIHRSEEHLFIYRTSTFEQDGVRDVMGAQISPPHCRLVETCAPPDPVDPALAAELGERHRVAEPMMAPLYTAVRDIAPATPAYSENLVEPLPARRSYDLERSRAIGNIPLPADYNYRDDTLPASSIQPVHRLPTADPVAERGLSRDVDLINQRTEQELGRAIPGQEHAPFRAPSHTPDKSIEHRHSPMQTQTPPEASMPRTAEPINATQPPLTREPEVPAPQAHITPPPVPSWPEPSRSAIAQQPPAPYAGFAPEPTYQAPFASPPAPPAGDVAPSMDTFQQRPDPRTPGHPDHAMNQSVREQVRKLYADENITLSEQHLECTTAAVMADARLSGITRVTSLEFSYDDMNRPEVNGYIFAYQGDPNQDGTPESFTDSKAAAITPPEQSYEQFQQATQHHHDREMQVQLQQARTNAQEQQQGLTI